MGEAKVTQLKNPHKMMELAGTPEYHSEIFILNVTDSTGDHVDYLALMNKLADPNQYVDVVDKSRNYNRDGEIVMHIEWIEYKMADPEDDKY